MTTTNDYYLPELLIGRWRYQEMLTTCTDCGTIGEYLIDGQFMVCGLHVEGRGNLRVDLPANYHDHFWNSGANPNLEAHASSRMKETT